MAPTPPPTAEPSTAPTTTWYTSAAARAAAQRMAAAGTVGDPACTLSAHGNPDPALIPHTGRIGIGTYGTYWCLIW
ncbi:hypothetical protein [Streptomyces maremycinicus]|uniref:hypothetical protein n=1 Tax=Streptomyces maremycinicus TaxID=1679753 RepID=UPI001331712A|nr:hypothetical protein [Streptomyces sp. NBRC 110468]